MRHDPLYLAFDVHGPSPAAMAKAQQSIRRAAAADTVITIPVVSAEGTSERQLRMGDFFKDIQVLPGFAGNAPSLRVVFCRHPEADRFWKDLMVRILRSAETVADQITVNLAYQGNDHLNWELLKPA